MNEDIMKGKWKQMKGKVKEQWGKLTDDDVDMIDGKAEQLVGRLQERYGYSKEKAEEEAKNPPLFKKLLSRGAVEEEALQNTIRRKKNQEQEKELWQMIIYTYGMETYEEMIQERRKITAERIRIAHLQAEKRKAFALNIVYLGLTAGLIYLGYLMALFVIDNWPKG